MEDFMIFNINNFTFISISKLFSYSKLSVLKIISISNCKVYISQTFQFSFKTRNNNILIYNENKFIILISYYKI